MADAAILSKEWQFHQKPVVYIGSQELAKISNLLPFNKSQSMVVHSLVSSLGLMSASFSATQCLHVITPQKASYKDLAISTDTHFLLDCPPFLGLADYVQMIGGATITAAGVLQRDLADISICWDGGRHHARKSQASGFCYVADCILAILAFRGPIPHQPSGPNTMSGAKRPRVMYLDLDLHYLDAVSDTFFTTTPSATPQILTLSIHHMSPGFCPTSAQAQLLDISSPHFNPFSLSMPLQHGASNATYHIKDAFSLDYIIIQCGVDALAGDWLLGWCVHCILTEWSGKKLLLGGGHNSPNAAQAWAYLTSIALDKPISLDAEIPDHVGFPLYGPSFTFGVPAGNMFDQNNEEYLNLVQT
ncbi:histone deacetylase complex protein [Crassisporium funariophilum]|nr:histone deacetylase complex protein [Crassisporium funariophilum]